MVSHKAKASPSSSAAHNALPVPREALVAGDRGPLIQVELF